MNETPTSLPRRTPATDPFFEDPGPLLRRRLATFWPTEIPHRFTDVLVIGSGVAGLSAAMAAASEGVEVLCLAKAGLEESATAWAQGGVAAVVFPERTGDSIERHIADTIDCAGGLADEAAVRVTVSEGVDRVRQLIDLGAEFDRDESGLQLLTREGAHSFPRILHRGDTTGQEIERALVASVLDRRNILCLPHTFAIELLTESGTCRGALVVNPHGQIEAIWARRTILATGGAGRLYRETTNPAVCTGDGLAMAFRAGAILRDLEFVQFHPTTLYVAGADRHLITEAVRGEGGRLLDESKQPFMERFHELGDLAPRDVVSRSILEVMKETGENKVWLDLSRIPEERILARFPHVHVLCKGFGIDILREPIPVRPSAHYSIGGVAVDLNGRTSLPGLLAAGEVSASGLHGANRLGSNSLLEGLVFGNRAGRLAACEATSAASHQNYRVPTAIDGHGPPESRPTRHDARQRPGFLDMEDLATSLKSLMWYKVGVERNGAELASGLRQIRNWMGLPLRTDFLDPRSWSLQNMLQTAYLLTLSALRREESRGVHYRSDFPETAETWRQHWTICREDFSNGEPSSSRES